MVINFNQVCSKTLSYKCTCNLYLKHVVITNGYVARRNNARIIRPTVEENPTTLSSLLIDSIHRVWREDIIESYFFKFEAATIKTIPFYRTIQEDVLIWPFKSDAEYLVKVGYKCLQDVQLSQQPGPSAIDTLKPLWKKIWSPNVPSKVKHLVWHACKNSLPTKANLVKRHVLTEGLCEICKLLQEDIVHVLYHYPDLEKFWSSIVSWNHGTLKQTTSLIDIWGFIFVDNRDPELFTSIVWAKKAWVRLRAITPVPDSSRHSVWRPSCRFSSFFFFFLICTDSRQFGLKPLFSNPN